MSDYSDRLTIAQAQKNQPWVVPYSAGVRVAAEGGYLDPPEKHSLPATVPHILGTHCALHATKSLGKIAAVYEARDHTPDDGRLRDCGRDVIRAAAADLMTAALRFANLEGFDLAEALVERVREKNDADFGVVSVPVSYCTSCNECRDEPECA